MGDIAAGAGAVVDDHRLVHARAEFGGDDAADQIVGATGGKAD